MPLVPVTPIIRVLFELFINISISPMIGTPDDLAFAATGWGCGNECGIPGLKTSASM